VAWSPNDEKFVTGGDDGLVKIWNFRAAEEERQLSGEYGSSRLPGMFPDL
jgi:polyadenylation factor subunit 2